MSNSQGKSRTLKRRFSDEEEVLGKRCRTEVTCPREPVPKERLPKASTNDTKNLAANRLNTLREGIKKAARPVKEAVKRTVAKLGTRHESNRSPTKTEPKISSTPTKGSINDRLKRARQKSEDNIIIEINDSPVVVPNKRLSGKYTKICSPISVYSESTPINQRLTKIKAQSSCHDSLRSFIVVSEASDSEHTETPIGRRLSTIKEFSSSNSSLETSGLFRGTNISEGLRLPLKRNIFNGPEKTPNCDFQASCKGIFGSQVSPRKQTSPKSKDDKQPNINNNALSPNRTETSKRSSITNRLARIRNETSIKRLEAPIDKSSIVQNWIESTHSRPNVGEQSINDSMVVNVDDTLLNKSVLLSEAREDNSMEWDAIIPQPELPNINNPTQKQNVLCIVTDTNVFMHDLIKIKDLLYFKFPGEQPLNIYVPWMVLQELDFHKDSHKQPAKSLAMTAQKWLNQRLAESDSRVIGQSVKEVCQQMDLGKSPDDKILACCLQAKEKFESVILLSNDVNLCNKVMTNDIKGYTARNILAKLRSSKYLKIKVRLQPLFSQIISQTCREAFGEATTKMDMLQNCPWPLEGCLKRFKKYWVTVFGLLLLKQCLKTIEELIAITDKGDITDPDQLIKFKDKVKEFLFYLQDIEQFNGAVKKVRDEIDSIV